MSSSRKFNARQFVSDLIDGAEKRKDIDAMAFGTVLITALVKQLGPEAAEIVKRPTSRKKAARKAKVTNSGKGAGTSAGASPVTVTT